MIKKTETKKEEEIAKQIEEDMFQRKLAEREILEEENDEREHKIHDRKIQKTNISKKQKKPKKTFTTANASERYGPLYGDTDEK